MDFCCCVPGRETEREREDCLRGGGREGSSHVCINLLWVVPIKLSMSNPPSPPSSPSASPSALSSPSMSSSLSSPVFVSPSKSFHVTRSLPPPPPRSSSSSIPAVWLPTISSAALFALFVILALLICRCKKKKNPRARNQCNPQVYHRSPSHYQDLCNGSTTQILPPQSPSPFGPFSSSSQIRCTFKYQDLATATSGFARSNLIGEGEFGSVHKGFLPGGKVVAIKQLKVGGGQMDKELYAELEIIRRVHHRHLVSLIGYCVADSQRLLVYDYIPNRNLNYHLHGKRRAILDWSTRVKIAYGAARGLAYLHDDCHPQMIHCDIKSSNILLDKDFDARVSDFGLVRLIPDMNTHVATRVVGTLGYLPPEYASSGKLTDKSDVFSFGIVLLELVTGRKPVDPTQSVGEESLVNWARPLLRQMNREENLELLADPFLNGAYDCKEMMRMMETAAACIRHSAAERPTMSQVLRSLEDDAALSNLNKCLKPSHSFRDGSFSSLDLDSSSYTLDMKRFRSSIESQGCSSEYSGAVSDYGMHPSRTSSEF